VKVHADGTGALKKRPAVDWKVRSRVDHKNSSAGPRCWSGNSFSTLPWQRHDAPEGEGLLKGIDCPLAGGPMVMA